MKLDFLARPERLELPTYWFEASRSIQLSYGRALLILAGGRPASLLRHNRIHQRADAFHFYRHFVAGL